MNDDRIDFSSLDPKRRPAHFERMVSSVLARIESRPLQWRAAIWRSGRIALAASFVAAAAAWAPTVIFGGGRADGRVEDRVEIGIEWAVQGRVPADVDPALALGAIHAR